MYDAATTLDEFTLYLALRLVEILEEIYDVESDGFWSNTTLPDREGTHPIVLIDLLDETDFDPKAMPEDPQFVIVLKRARNPFPKSLKEGFEVRFLHVMEGGTREIYLLSKRKGGSTDDI